MVGRARAARRAAGGLRHRDGRAGRRRAAGRRLAGPLAFVGVGVRAAAGAQPIHQAVSANLGDRTAAWLYDRLTEACVRPPGMGHLEDPELTSDLTVARDFDLGMTGPPLSISMDFIAGGLVEMIGGLASACVLFAYAWWAPLAARRRVARHALAAARERDLARPQHRRSAQRAARRRLRLPARRGSAGQPRSCGCSASPAGPSTASSPGARACTQLQYEATRLRERPVLWSVLLVVAANVVVFWSLARAAVDGRLDLGSVVIFAQSAIGASMIAFGGLNWALDGAAAPVAAVLRLEAAMAPAGALRGRRPTPPTACPRARSASATSRSPIRRRRAGPRGLRSDDSGRIVAGDRRAERRRQDDAGQAAVPAYDPQSGAIEVDGVDLRELDIDVVAVAGHGGVPGLHPLRAAAARQRRARRRARRRRARRARPQARRAWPTSTRSWPAATRAAPTCPAASGSASRWPERCARCAWAPAWCCSTSPPRSSTCGARPRSSSACSRATRHCTTILISHRFSTVRHADRICVLEHGKVVELGSHDELMAQGGRYRTMFDLQAQRFERSATRTRRRWSTMSSRDRRRTPSTTICRPRSPRCGGSASSATTTSPGSWWWPSSLSLLAALPDALLAIWFKLLGEGVLKQRRGLVRTAAIGLGVSATATWFLRTCRRASNAASATRSPSRSSRTSPGCRRRSPRSPITNGLSTSTASRCCATRSSCSTTCTCRCSRPWVGYCASVSPSPCSCRSIPRSILLAVFALPTVLTSSWRPAVERVAQERGAQSDRRAKHLFTLATTAPPGKEVRVTGIGPRLIVDRREAWERWYGPVASARWGSAVWHTLAWAVFGAGFVGAVVFVSSGLNSPPADVLLVLASGSRLSAYIGATVGEIGFLRGIWMDGSRRLAWLEDYAAAMTVDHDVPGAVAPRGKASGWSMSTSRTPARRDLSLKMSTSRCRRAQLSRLLARTTPRREHTMELLHSLRRTPCGASGEVRG